MCPNLPLILPGWRRCRWGWLTIPLAVSVLVAMLAASGPVLAATGGRIWVQPLEYALGLGGHGPRQEQRRHLSFLAAGIAATGGLPLASADAPRPPTAALALCAQPPATRGLAPAQRRAERLRARACARAWAQAHQDWQRWQRQLSQQCQRRWTAVLVLLLWAGGHLRGRTRLAPGWPVSLATIAALGHTGGGCWQVLALGRLAAADQEATRQVRRAADQQEQWELLASRFDLAATSGDSDGH